MSNHTPKEDDVLRRRLYECALGQPEALREVYDIAGPRMFAMLLRMLRQRQLAEDALQEIFVRIWHRASSYRAEKGRPINWLLGITRYHALDQIRKNKREIPVLDEDSFTPAFEQNRSQSETESTHADAIADQGAVRYCMGKLEQQQQRSLELAFLDGYSHPEVATALKTPLGTVKSWIRRGLKALRDCIRHEV